MILFQYYGYFKIISLESLQWYTLESDVNNFKFVFFTRRKNESNIQSTSFVQINRKVYNIGNMIFIKGISNQAKQIDNKNTAKKNTAQKLLVIIVQCTVHERIQWATFTLTFKRHFLGLSVANYSKDEYRK